MSKAQDITVRVLKHDGVEYRRWNATLSRQDGDVIVLDAEFDVDVNHEVLGRVKQHTRTIEYYWLGRWYNVFRFLQDDGSTRLWYCNINTPPTLENGVLSYIDLDIDVLVQPDFTYQVLDVDEFEENAKLFGYEEDLRDEVQRAIADVISLIEARQFPFTESEQAIAE